MTKKRAPTAPEPRRAAAAARRDSHAEPAAPAVRSYSLRDVPVRSPELARRAIAEPGAPLAGSTRERFERSFGTDLGDVSIHRDPVAERSAEMLGVRGYAIGRHVVLGPRADERTLAHEVAHAVQQGIAPAPASDVPVTAPGSAPERDADRAAGDVMSGQSAHVQASPVAMAADGVLVLSPFMGRAGVERVLMSPATMKNATSRFAMLMFALGTLTPEDAVAVKAEITNRKTKLGGRFQRLRTKSRTDALAVLDHVIAKKAASATTSAIATGAATAATSPRDALADAIDHDEAWGVWTGGSGDITSALEMEQNTPEAERGFYSSVEWRTWYFEGYRGIAKLPDPKAALELLASVLITDPAVRKAFFARHGLATRGSVGVTSAALDAARASGNLDAAVAAIGTMPADSKLDAAFASGDYSSITFDEVARGRTLEDARYLVAFERWLLDGREATIAEIQAAKPELIFDPPDKFIWIEVDKSKGSRTVHKYGWGDVEIPNQADGAVSAEYYEAAGGHKVVREFWFHVKAGDEDRGRRQLLVQWTTGGPFVGIDDGHGTEVPEGYVMPKAKTPRIPGVRSVRPPGDPIYREEAKPLFGWGKKKSADTDEETGSTGGGKKPSDTDADTTTGSKTDTKAEQQTDTTAKTKQTDTTAKAKQAPDEAGPQPAKPAADTESDAPATTSDTDTDTTARPTGRRGDDPNADPPVFAGRVREPEIATKNRYRWTHRSEPKGNFVDATLGDDGTLTITVRASGPNRRGGKKLIQDVFKYFVGKVKAFKGLWVKGTKFETNYNEYMANLKNGMSKEDAAWNTWIGKQLKDEYGFTKVTVPDHGPDPDSVSPVFTKPGGDQ